MKKHFALRTTLTSAAAASLLVFASAAQDTANQPGVSGEAPNTGLTNSGRADSVGGKAIGQQPYSSTAAATDQTATADRANDANQAGLSATNAVTDANNSARNARDRNDQTLTPGDQGNNSADVSTTRQIRKEIIAAKDMSLSARNVKIITVGGRVTLRGPVKTEQEKQLIAEIASRIAQPANVDNQLEVKITPTGRE
jgi:hyperosmotically inducible protein